MSGNQESAEVVDAIVLVAILFLTQACNQASLLQPLDLIPEPSESVLGPIA